MVGDCKLRGPRFKLRHKRQIVRAVPLYLAHLHPAAQIRFPRIRTNRHHPSSALLSRASNSR